ncbi:MAG: hypothetical protein A2169_00755 [Deltaproteobacteria bacterium RBG_13_47_9]|nr:MAG: hypothetical protein A2169_00755 [Deltaproteobacteria bacterium RBG_13_47_9]
MKAYIYGVAFPIHKLPEVIFWCPDIVNVKGVANGAVLITYPAADTEKQVTKIALGKFSPTIVQENKV